MKVNTVSSKFKKILQMGTKALKFFFQIRLNDGSQLRALAAIQKAEDKRERNCKVYKNEKFHIQ